MVLAKRNADGEFVVWNSSLQASNASNNNQSSQEHDNDQAPAPKRARVSPQNSSPSHHLRSSASSARNVAAGSRDTAVHATATNSTYSTLATSPDIEIIASASNLPHVTPRPIPAKWTRAATQVPAIHSQKHVDSSSAQLPSQYPGTSVFLGSGRVEGSATSSTAKILQPSPISLPSYPAVSVSYHEPSQLSASVPPAKRGRMATSVDPTERPEKRLAMFKKKCPQNILDRVERVMTQRIFMIDRNRTGELKEVFSVLGSTGNVYNVVVDHKPWCDCPDAMKGNHCKHILFIMLKVLQVNQGSGHWYQKHVSHDPSHAPFSSNIYPRALLTSELEEIFAGAPLAPNSMAHPHIRDAYARATGKAPTQSTDKRRVPGPDDDCPVCYDGMHGVAEESLIFCEDCGNALHKECFVQWQRTAASAGKDLTCVWCRARWVLGQAAVGGSGGASMGPEGYLNLANVGGVSPVRDTSTYYHGSSRRSRYQRYRY